VWAILLVLDNPDPGETVHVFNQVMKQTISKDLKEQILARVREGKETVAEIGRQHGVNPNTIYNWISRQGMTAGSPLLELSRAKKEILFFCR
jgi:transposase-like protein